MDNTSKSKLADFDIDNLAKALAFNGFKDQGQGLLAFNDQHFEGRVKTTELVRSEIPGIMKRAADFKSRKQQYQPGPSEPSQAEQSKSNPSLNNLARIQRFRELRKNCFDYFKHSRFPET